MFNPDLIVSPLNKGVFFINRRNPNVVIDAGFLIGLYDDKGNNLFDFNDVSSDIRTAVAVFDDSDPGRDLSGMLRINSEPLHLNTEYTENTYREGCHFLYTFESVRYPEETIYLRVVFEVLYPDSLRKKCEFALVFSDSVSGKRDIYPNSGEILSSISSSALLLRTNPRLTGNIKLVVDTNYRLYLDTFKVSSALSNNRYRHRNIASSGDYARDVHTIFGSLPEGELFKVPAKALDPHIKYTNYKAQYETIYEYGAETNDDSLYEDNMRILAPLWIGNTLPDFFCIFRTPEHHNQETYDSNGYMNDDDVFRRILSEGKMVGCYDLRPSTTIGEYLNNYHATIKDNIGSCYLQFNEQDTAQDYTLQGRNCWRGISVNRGVLTDKYETTYFSNRILEDPNGTQERLNNYVTGGYERNNLLIPNILNLEFMFNDPETKVYTMHRYYGLYLKANEFFKYAAVIRHSSGQSVELIRYDDEYKVIDDRVAVGLIDDKNYSDRMFMAVTDKTAGRVQSENELSNFIDTNVANVPHVNIIASPTKEIETGISYVALKFTDSISYGEHFRILVPEYTLDDGTKTSAVFELIASNDKRLMETDFVHPYVSINRNHLPQAGTNLTKYPYMFRLAFYTQDINDPLQPATIYEQLKRIATGVARFGEGFYVGDVSNDSISIVTTYDNAVFQHISSDILDLRDKDPETYRQNDYIRYFDPTQTTEMVPLDNDTASYTNDTGFYAPVDFEVLGWRMHAAVRFFKTIENTYSVSGDAIGNKDIPRLAIVLTSNGYQTIEHVVLEWLNPGPEGLRKTNTTVMRSMAPMNTKDILIHLPDPVVIINGGIQIYTPISCTLNLMGILSIRDMDCRLLYSDKDEYTSDACLYMKENERVCLDDTNPKLVRAKRYRLTEGAFREVGIPEKSVFYILSNTVYYLAAGTGNDVVSKYVQLPGNILTAVRDTKIVVEDEYPITYDVTTGYTEMTPFNFFSDPMNLTTSKLDYPISVPVVSYWDSLGMYYDHDDVLDRNKANDKSYQSDMRKNNTGFFETYRPGTGKETTQFVQDNLDEAVFIGDELITFRDLITKETGVSVKNIIHQYLTTDVTPHHSVAYYNKYIDTLEFIYAGMKFVLRLSSSMYNKDIRLNDYNNYKIFVVSDYRPGVNNEMFVSNEEHTILIVNHNFRVSDSELESGVFFNTKFELDPGYMWVTNPWVIDPYRVFGTDMGLIYRKIYQSTISTGEYNPEDYYIQSSKAQNDVLSDWNYYVYFGVTPSGMEGAGDDSEYVSLKYMNDDNKKTYLFQIKSLVNTVYNDGIENGDMEGTEGNRLHRFNSERVALIDFQETYNSKSWRLRYSRLPELENNYFELYRESLTNDVDIYIIPKDGDTKRIKMTKSYKPLTIDVILPNFIKYNNGYYIPKMYDVVKFETREDDGVSSVCRNNFLLGNTKFKKVDRLLNYVGNKVFKDNGAADKDDRIDSNYFILNERSLLSTNWDNNFYRLYSTPESYKQTAGYRTGVEEKTFFGSTCIRLDREPVDIIDWTDTGTQKDIITYGVKTSKQGTNTDAKSVYEIRVNITKAFYKIFKDKLEGLMEPFETFESTDLNNYITQSFIRYYHINESNAFSLYMENDSASFSIQRSRPSDLEKGWTELTNFATEYKEDNNEIIMIITIDRERKLYPVLRLRR